MCVHACGQLYSAMHMSLVTAVNKYTFGFTHISNCPTISNVKVCAILYNTLVLLVHINLYVRTYITNHLLYSRKSCVKHFTIYRMRNIQRLVKAINKYIFLVIQCCVLLRHCNFLCHLSVQLLSTAVAMTLRRGCVCRQCRWSMKWLPSTWT